MAVPEAVERYQSGSAADFLRTAGSLWRTVCAIHLVKGVLIAPTPLTPNVRRIAAYLSTLLKNGLSILHTAWVQLTPLARPDRGNQSGLGPL